MEETNADSRLGFIEIVNFQDFSVRGGLLVTDVQTRPYEFRVTSPIKPTQLQQILYGSTLTEFIFAELICVPLLKACKEEINLVIVNQHFLLNMRPKVSIPVIYINKQNEKNGNHNLFDYQIHKNFKTEEESAKYYIDLLAENTDIFEPFERIKTAVNEVHLNKLDEKT